MPLRDCLQHPTTPGGENLCVFTSFFLPGRIAPETWNNAKNSNALDIAAQVQLRETMCQLAQAGLGILLVTHHVSEIIPEIERVVLVREGRILADGPKEEILTAERLTDLFSVPVQLVRRDGYFHSV